MEQLSRRDFFRKTALLGLLSFSVTSLSAKGLKEKFNYQDSPKDGKKCKDCMHFIVEKNECRIIEGSISPDGWCNLYNVNPNKKS